MVHALPSSQELGVKAHWTPAPGSSSTQPQADWHSSGALASFTQMLSQDVLQQKGSIAQTQSSQAWLSGQPGPLTWPQHALAEFPGLHASMVQGSLSSQAGTVTHPLRGSQLSVVQGLPSSQETAMLVQAPVTPSQESSVQALLSLQSFGVLEQTSGVA
jgi:hypothetical protein